MKKRTNKQMKNKLYRLKFFDDYYKEYKEAYSDSLYNLLNTWGIWLNQKEWYIHIQYLDENNNTRFLLIGRSKQC
jgi:hypothetical protein